MVFPSKVLMKSAASLFFCAAMEISPVDRVPSRSWLGTRYLCPSSRRGRECRRRQNEVVGGSS
jgi:hypothetical protein